MFKLSTQMKRPRRRSRTERGKKLKRVRLKR